MRKSLIVVSFASLSFFAGFSHAATLKSAESFSGYVSEVNAAEKSITITSSASQARTFVLKPTATVVTSEGKAIDIANIKAGTYVKMKRYTDTATSAEVRGAAPAASLTVNAAGK